LWPEGRRPTIGLRWGRPVRPVPLLAVGDFLVERGLAARAIGTMFG
jgi:hypothetical protein